MMDSILRALGIPCQVKQLSCRKKAVAELCLQETGKGLEMSWGLCELFFNRYNFNFVLRRDKNWPIGGRDRQCRSFQDALDGGQKCQKGILEPGSFLSLTLIWKL